jgi:hypothetical protein
VARTLTYMTPLLLLVLFLVVAGIAGNLGWIKSNSDPEHPEEPFIRHP